MANVNKPHGLVPIRREDGTTWNGQVKKIWCDTGKSLAIFKGDPIIRETDSYVRQCTANEAILGVAVYFEYQDANSKWVLDNTIAAATAGWVYYVPAEGMVFEIQEDADTVSLVEADMMGSGDLVVAAGNATTKLSGFTLNSDDVDDDTASQVLVLRLFPVVDNAYGTAAAGNYGRFEVIILQTQFKATPLA